MNNNVLAYFEPVDNMQFSKDSFNLLERWKSNWLSQGWNPIILNQDIAKRNPYFNKINFKSMLEKFRVVRPNQGEYLTQCFLRWLAYTQFVFDNGSTVWCDYDVYNRSLTYTKHTTLPPTSRLYCGSGSVGLMDEHNAKLILESFLNVAESDNIKQIKNLSPRAQTHIDKYAITFADMHIVQNVFFEPPAKITKLCTCFYDPPSVDIKSFDLFHIHGGVADPSNKDRLSINFPYHLNLKRGEQWDYIVNLLQ